MNSYDQKLEQKKSRVLEENNAQAIFDHLTELANLGGVHERRWLWELLQNAKDSIDESRTVSVEVDFQGDHLLFQHNGTPFTDDEIIHLIYHGSTKKGSADKTGKFGTGFLTTHLLSKKVHVSGILDGDREFNFVLDRSGKDPKEVEAAMKSSWEDFKKSQVESKSKLFTTTYRYVLDAESSVVAKKGLLDLPRLLPFVLAFNPKLESFTLKTSNESTTFQRISVRTTNHCNIAMVTIKSSDQNFQSSLHTLAISSKDKTAVAIPCDITPDDVTVTVKPLDADLPRLFYDFPLFGTEDFSFPAIINSSNFVPKSERDGVYLGDKSSEDITCNKQIIQHACQLYLQLVEYASSEKWENLYDLAFIAGPTRKDWLDPNWYKNTLQDFHKEIITKKIVKVEGAEHIAPKDALFPIDSAHDLWELSFPIFSDKLTAKIYIDPWLKVVKSWGELLDKPIESFDNTVTIEKLCKILSELTTLDELKNKLHVEDDGQAIAWLNILYSILFSEKKNHLFESHPIIPNQNREFRKKTPDLFLDDQIDEIVKDISKAIGDDPRTYLVLKTVSLGNAFLALKNQEEILSSTLLSFKKKAAEIGQDSPLRKPAIDILVWLVQQKRADLLSDIPVVSMKVETGSSTPFSKFSTTNRFLIPSKLWRSIPLEFAELFPPDFILSSEYNERLAVKDWELLADKQFVHLEPLFKEDIKLENHDNQLRLSVDDGKEHQLKTIECSQIAFLEYPKDKGIIDRIRKSKQRSVLFFKLLLTCIIENDSKWSETIDVSCECGISHSVLPSHWFYRIRARQWIPTSSGSETPSAQSLSALLKNEQALILKLKEDKPAKFLNKLGIGVGELLRNIVAGDDDTKKLEWDKAFGAILTSGLDPGKLVTEFEERERNKQKVIENQKLGKEIESIFEMTFKSPEFKALGFSIERKPIGSDFEVEHDFIEGDQEQVIDIKGSKKSALIEIKTTGKSFVRMTGTQGKTSVDNQDSFCLCVVPLNGAEIAGDIIRSNARFVTDIGKLLRSKVFNISALQDLQNEAVSTGGDIQIDMTESQIRYRVNQTIWQNGKNFDEFVSLLMSD